MRLRNCEEIERTNTRSFLSIRKVSVSTHFASVRHRAINKANRA
jgi:hypothetical protein